MDEYANEVIWEAGKAIPFKEYAFKGGLEFTKRLLAWQKVKFPKLQADAKAKIKTASTQPDTHAKKKRSDGDDYEEIYDETAYNRPKCNQPAKKYPDYPVHNIGEDIHGFADNLLGDRCPKDDKTQKREFTDEDRKRFIEERERYLEEVWSRKTNEELIASSIKTYSAIPMFDFGLGEKTNHQAIMDFYGYELYKRMVREINESYEGPSDKREPGHITKELWQMLRDLRAGRKPKSKQAKSPIQSRPTKPETPSTAEAPVQDGQKAPIPERRRQRQPGDDYVLQTERGLIRNAHYRDLFKGPGTVYEFIWANMVRKGWHDTDEFPIRKMYHDDRKLLVYCTSFRNLARQCKMSVNTVIEIVRRFEAAGIIKTEPYTPSGKKQAQTVLILGYWTGSGTTYKEHYYRDEVLLSPNVAKK